MTRRGGSGRAPVAGAGYADPETGGPSLGAERAADRGGGAIAVGWRAVASVAALVVGGLAGAQAAEPLAGWAGAAAYLAAGTGAGVLAYLGAERLVPRRS